MEAVAISKFKATCLAVLERVRRTGRPVLVTRFGKPIAEIVPPSKGSGGKRKLGGMEPSVEFIGDVISPVVPESDWDALRQP
jgi:prevent-host-death family protein